MADQQPVTVRSLALQPVPATASLLVGPEGGWTEEEVRKKLRDVLVKAFHEVLETSRKHNVDMRLAALMIGIDRVTQAMLWRGLYA